MSRRLIRFTFEGESQDIEWFRSILSRWRDGLYDREHRIDHAFFMVNGDKSRTAAGGHCSSWRDYFYSASGRQLTTVPARPRELTLFFPMTDLFEASIASLLRRAFAGSDMEVVAQGGLRYCLGDWADGADCTGTTFQTRPDIIIRRGDEILAIIDTKWKAIAEPFEGKGGVSQADVYQMMAYSRLYRSQDLMLLYPSRPGEGDGERNSFGLQGGAERLRIVQVDVSRDVRTVVASLSTLLAHVRDLPHNERDAKELLVSSVD